MNKNKILLTLISVISFSLNASPKITFQDGPGYYNACFDEIKVLRMTSPAEIPFDMTKTSYDAFWQAVNTAMMENSRQQIEALSSNLNSLVVTYQQVQESEYHKRLQMKTEIDEVSKEFDLRYKMLEEEINSSEFPQPELVLNPDNPPPISRNSPEFLYFKAKCDNEKIAASVGKDAREIANYMVNAEINTAVAEQVDSANSLALQINKQKEIIQNYCSESDSENGVCEQASPTPYAHASAELFLTPSGFGDLNAQSTFKTKYTYNDVESEIARDFLSTVIQTFAVESPRPSDINDPNKAKYIATYTSYLSALNLANYSFTMARQNRLKKGSIKMTQTLELPVSYYDTLRYLIHKTNSSEQLVAISNANAKAQQRSLYEAMTLNSKLQLEIYLQSKRMNLIDSAILSVMENSPKELIYLDKIK